MGLLSPWFLAGLGLLALPVYLHLLKRHRSELQHFSSLMFFEKSLQADLRRRRLDFLKLLATRLALLLLAVLAFAQPFLRRGASPQPATRLIVVDTSASMGAGDRMERARAAAARLATPQARLASFDSRLTLLDASAGPALQAGPSAGSFGELARALRAYQENLKGGLDVHFVSDLQRSSMPAGFADLRLSASTTLHLHGVASGTEPNWTVEGVSAPARLRQARGARIRATIAGFHTPAARKTAILEINGLEVARRSADVPPEGRATLEFESPELPYGFSRCQVRLTGPDRLPADDSYVFAIERSDARRVVFIGSPRAENYFRNALDAATGSAYAVVRGGGLGQASFVVVADAQPPEPALRDYVRSGGAAFIALGLANSAAGLVPATGLPARGTRYAPRQGERFMTLGAVDSAYPPLARAAMWEGVRFYQAVDADAGSARVAARLSDGTPLLTEARIGEGTVIVLASSLDGLANDLPLNPAFVPFVEQVAHRLSGWQEATISVPVDTQIDVAADGASKAVEVLDPDGASALSFEHGARGRPLSISRTGLWQVRRGAGRTQVIAANIDRRESDLAPMDRESSQLWEGRSGPDPAPPAPGAGPAGAAPLSPWLLAAAVAACLVEIWMASNYWRREVQ